MNYKKLFAIVALCMVILISCSESQLDEKDLPRCSITDSKSSSNYVNVKCNADAKASDSLSGTQIVIPAFTEMSVPMGSLLGVEKNGEIFFLTALGNREITLNRLTDSYEIGGRAAWLALQTQKSADKVVKSQGQDAIPIAGLILSQQSDKILVTNPKLRSVVTFSNCSENQYNLIAPRESGLSFIGGVAGSYLWGEDIVSSESSIDTKGVDPCGKGCSVSAVAGAFAPTLAMSLSPWTAPFLQPKLNEYFDFVSNLPPEEQKTAIISNVLDTYFYIIYQALEIASVSSLIDVTGTSTCLLALLGDQAVSFLAEAVVPLVVENLLNSRITDTDDLIVTIISQIERKLKNPSTYVDIYGDLLTKCGYFACNASGPFIPICKAVTGISAALKNGGNLQIHNYDYQYIGSYDFLTTPFFGSITLPLHTDNCGKEEEEEGILENDDDEKEEEIANEADDTETADDEDEKEQVDGSQNDYPCLQTVNGECMDISCYIPGPKIISLSKISNDGFSVCWEDLKDENIIGYNLEVSLTEDIFDEHVKYKDLVCMPAGRFKVYEDLQTVLNQSCNGNRCCGTLYVPSASEDYYFHVQAFTEDVTGAWSKIIMSVEN